MLAGETHTCSALFSSAGCHTLAQAESVVTTLSSVAIALMLLPLLVLFVADFATYTARCMVSYTTRRIYCSATAVAAPTFAEIDLKFKSHNAVKDFFKSLTLFRGPVSPKLTWLRRWVAIEEAE